MSDRQVGSYGNVYSESRVTEAIFRLGWQFAKGVGFSAIRLATVSERIVTGIVNSRTVDSILDHAGSLLDHGLGGVQIDTIDETVDASHSAVKSRMSHRLETAIAGGSGGLIIGDELGGQNSVMTTDNHGITTQQRIAGDI